MNYDRRMERGCKNNPHLSEDTASALIKGLFWRVCAEQRHKRHLKENIAKYRKYSAQEIIECCE